MSYVSLVKFETGSLRYKISRRINFPAQIALSRIR